MTFDEAFEKVEQLANFEIGKTTGDIRRDFKLELGDVRDLFTELREEYAPTVEMTKHQKFVFMRLHENKKPVFVDIDTVYNTPEFASIDTDLLIIAWFHPEIIKVVDE